MIIKCPNCEFSGRIPSHAVDSPHNATCPRCRFRFELHSLFSEQGTAILARPELEIDPGSSAYELKAITEDFGELAPAGAHPEPWDKDEEVLPLNGSGSHARDLAADSSATTPAWETHSAGRAVLMPASGEPWYSRVLQIWGIMFLLWAGLILARSLFLLFSAENGPLNGSDVLSSVVSVMLLVPGAAGLFLLADLGRYLRGLRSFPTRGSKAAATPARPGPLSYRPGRAWNRLLQAAFAARP